MEDYAMPRIFTVKKTVYKFDELSERAKDKAREWWRSASAGDEWWDAVYEDATQCAAILGIDIATKSQRWTNPTSGKSGTHHYPAIFFSGFWSQGDGACFEGCYAYAKDAPTKIREHAPQDVELQRIADALQALPPHFGASMAHRGHYYHSGCMAVDVTCDGADLSLEPSEAVQDALIQLMRSFADWIYRQLENEHDYLNADAQVDDNIRANEYEFDVNGERARHDH